LTAGSASCRADVAGAVTRSLAAAAVALVVAAAVRAVVSAAFSDASAAATAASIAVALIALGAATRTPTFVLAAAVSTCSLVSRARSLPLACLLPVAAVMHVIVAACVVVITVAARAFVRTVAACAAVLAAFAGFGSTDISDRSPPLTPRRAVTRRLLLRELRVLVPGAQHE